MATLVLDEPGIPLAGDTEWTPDVTIAFRPEHHSTATEHPVEDGSKITDHVIQEADRITIEALVSNTPITETDGGSFRTLPVEIPVYKAPFTPTPGGVTRGVLGLVEQGVAALRGTGPAVPHTLQWLLPLNRPKEAYDRIDEWRKGAKRLRVIDALREYDSMLIESISVERSVEVGDAARFTITLRRISVVSTALATGLPIPAEARGMPKTNVGQQLGKTPSNASEVGETTKKSLLLKAMQGVGLLDDAPGLGL